MNERHVATVMVNIPHLEITDHLKYGRRVWGGGVGAQRDGEFTRGKNKGKPRFVVTGVNDYGTRTARSYVNAYEAAWALIMRAGPQVFLTVTEYT